ncbi:MAG: MBL fold metallo-hydrolase [Actinomycetota bacterium]
MPILQLNGDVTVHQISTRSVGDHSYVILAGDTAAVIDPQRDIDRLTGLFGSASLNAVMETHVHNDYVSGGALLASGYGSRYLLPSGSGASVRHDAVVDGDRIDIADGWHLRALHTPGHTPHHTSYALVSGGGELVVFTGGSMLVGAVGRTDLVNPNLTDGLTRDQYRSVRRLAEILGDTVVVAPTHGAGSFCAAGPVGGPTSTIAEERTRNPALVIDGIDEFVAAQRAGYGLIPAHYRHMAPINQAGATPVPTSPPVRSPEYVASFAGRVVDMRFTPSFAAGHIPGSISIPYSAEAAIYVAWVLPWRTPVILISDSPPITSAMCLDLARIGYDAVDGVVIDGLAAWRAAGHPEEQSRVASFAQLAKDSGVRVLDVRDPHEATFVIPGATRIHFSELGTADFDDADGPVWVHCSAGYRSVIAASILNARGIEAVAITDLLSAYTGPQEPT